MRDKLGEHEDRMDSIFYRLKRLEDQAHSPVDWLEQIEDFKDEVKKRIIDFDFRLNELELDFEAFKQRGQPREKKS